MAETKAAPQFALQRVYLKDASLETPEGAAVFTKGWKPDVKLDLNTKTSQLDESHYEVVLTLTVTIKNDEKTALLIELQQAGIFIISGLEDQQLGHTLGAFCPSILFPYARETVDSFMTRASFPPLMLAPVNFDALYAQQLQQRAQQQKAAENGAAEETH
ncbi:MAG: protein-export chaperone SecB [Nitrincola lacisaponensis]|uniref:Protein-export protein SecB n=1 Tax=Nitrincola lacisaponensis TaxID=267850 RepID=A0A063Y107_9GAMM|nr:protein-export chaperone SecB [Nitrincola lacisaponensis]KDE38855.1 Protein export cytoplasm chaperone protein (SecB, maintains protein to be exported in unfolded state) [Nitrincola lacisaponensis]